MTLTHIAHLVLSLTCGQPLAVSPHFMLPASASPPVSPPSLQLDAMERMLMACPTDIPRRAFLDTQLPIARSMLSSRTKGYGLFIRSLASELGTVGDVDAAMVLLAELIKDPETPHDEISSLRMLGQHQLARRDTFGAADSFRRAIEKTIKDPASARAFSSSLVSLISWYKVTQEMLGQPEQAMWANDIVLGPLKANFDADAVITAYESRSAYYRDHDTPARRLATLDVLFAEFPRYGLDADDGVGTRMRWLELHDPILADNDYIAGLRQIWESGGIRSAAREGAIALTLADSHRRRGEIEEAIFVLGDLDARLESAQHPGDPRETLRLRVQALQDIASLSTMLGDREGAIAALDRLDAIDPVTGPYARARHVMRDEADLGKPRSLP